MPKRDLTVGEISAHIKNIAIPASIGFFFQTMYNVVDTLYAGKISTDALSAMSISFPVFFIIIAFANGISVGASALISNAIGSKQKEHSQVFAEQAISFGIIFALLLTIFGISIAPIIFKALGATGEYLFMATSYINIIFLGTVFFITTNAMNSILLAIGNTRVYRNILIGGFFLNLVLDPWFLYGGFGLPAMGIKGIALATVVTMILGNFYMISKVVKSGFFTGCKMCNFIPKKKPYLEIIRQGFPASLNMMTIAIGIFVITFFLSKYGKEAVAAYGISTRIEQIILLPTMGLNMAAMAIIGQNNGAKQIDRVKETLKIALKYGMSVISIGAVLMFVLAKPMMLIFTNNENVVEIGKLALRIAAFTSCSYVILMIHISSLQAMKKPMYAFYMGIFKQVLFPFLLFYLLTIIFKLPIISIWLGIFAINWISAIITFFYTRKFISSQEKNL